MRIFVHFVVLFGGVPGLLLGHVLARGRAAIERRKAGDPSGAAQAERPDLPAPQMLCLGDPYPHGPVEDVRLPKARARNTSR